MKIIGSLNYMRKGIIESADCNEYLVLRTPADVKKVVSKIVKLGEKETYWNVYATFHRETETKPDFKMEFSYEFRDAGTIRWRDYIARPYNSHDTDCWLPDALVSADFIKRELLRLMETEADAEQETSVA